MSRAEMLVQWFSEVFAGVVDFFTYYANVGFDLWGDSALVPFVRFACICYALTMWWAWQQTDDDLEEGFFSRVKTTLIITLFFGSSAALISWVVLNLLLGFFFGPVRP